MKKPLKKFIHPYFPVAAHFLDALYKALFIQVQKPSAARIRLYFFPVRKILGGCFLFFDDEIQRVLGSLDEAKLFDIMTLRPTILDVEEASLLLAGDSDVFGAGPPLKPVAGEIVAILTADEEEEPPSAR